MSHTHYHIVASTPQGTRHWAIGSKPAADDWMAELRAMRYGASCEPCSCPKYGVAPDVCTCSADYLNISGGRHRQGCGAIA